MKERNKLFYFINILYNSLMIFYTKIPSLIVAIISFGLFLYNYYYYKKKFNGIEALFLISIVFLPVSFVSVLGTSYSQLPLTWFSFSLIVIFINQILMNKIKSSYFCILFLFCIFAIISLLFNDEYFISGISQFITICLFLISFQIGEFLKEKCNSSLKKEMLKLYLMSVLAFSFQIVLQRMWIINTGDIIGHYAAMGGGRIAYAGLMGDYSFATLYIASGCLLAFLKYVRLNEIKFINFIILILIFLISSIFISARTGLVSLALTLVLYFLFNFRKNTFKLLFLVVIALLSSPLIIQSLLSVRTMNNLFDDSGRFELILESIKLIENNFLFGIGFGIDKIKYSYNMIVPHNFFIQYILQFGIIGFSLVFANFAIFINKYIKTNYISWLFILVFIGAMFIPDIFSSRYLTTIIIMVIINSNFCIKEEIYEYKKTKRKNGL